MNQGLTLCSLGSGSAGNAVYVSDGETSVLIDAGFSGKELQGRMALAGLDPASVRAVVVTHEHQDHLRGVGILCRRLSAAAWFSRETFQASRQAVGKLVDVNLFSPGKQFTVGKLSFAPFSTSHDAADPVGFTVTGGGVKIGIATDLGVATKVVAHHLQGCRAILLEANHDPKMLEEGPYPWHLKQRVRSRLGHLSNQDSRDLLGSVLSPCLGHIILGHLSETNNRPEIALSVVGEALNGHRAELFAASQGEPAKVVHVKA
ncbi:MAG: MBL fold metallo-hydrolase [Thermodesulfobacteriota bacterium]